MVGGWALTSLLRLASSGRARDLQLQIANLAEGQVYRTLDNIRGFPTGQGRVYAEAHGKLA